MENNNIINEIYEKIKTLLPIQLGNPKIKTRALDLLENLDIEINDFLLPCVETLLYEKNKEVVNKINHKANFKVLSGRLYLDIKNMNDLLVDIKRYFSSFESNFKIIDSLIKSTLSDNINDRTMTYQQYGLYQFLEQLAGDAEYAKRLIYYVMVDKDDSVLRKNFGLDILTYSVQFKNNVLNKNNSIENKLKEIKELSTEAVYDKATDLDVPAPMKEANMDIDTLVGFNGNPFYAIGKWLVEKQLDRRDLAITLKNLTDLKITEIKSQLDNNPSDESLVKQLNYWEDKLNSYDAQIAKLERV